MEEIWIKGTDNIKYSATQVSEMYELPVSTVRHYMATFGEFLDLEYSNKMRKFSKSSLKKFEYILELRSEGYSIQQIKEFCEREEVVQSKELSPHDNSLKMQMLTDIINKSIESQFKKMCEQISEDVTEKLVVLLKQQISMNDNLKNDITQNIKNVVDDKINNNIKEVKDIQDKINKEIKDTNKIIKDVHDIAFVTKQEIEEAKSKQGLLKKIQSLFK